MEFAYYPGCSLESTAREYNESTKETLERLGVYLREIPGWSCCGATSAHSLDQELALALAARNLSLTENMGMDILAPCAACFSVLRKAQKVLKHDRLAREKVEVAIGRELSLSNKVRHLLDVLFNEVTPAGIKSRVERPLSNLRVVGYYGCYLVRPPEIADFDDPENPMILDEILKSLGAEVVDWSAKVDCCGGSLSITQPTIAKKLIRKVVASALEVEADVIVTACPLCQNNLDVHQEGSLSGEGIPVAYVSEIAAVALGITPEEKWFKRHFVDPSQVLNKRLLSQL